MLTNVPPRSISDQTSGEHQVSKIDVHQIPVLSDNYIYLARDASSGACAVIDPAVPEPVLDAAKELGWSITHILNTHHHGDHVGGNMTIKQATGCTIVGPRADRDRIPGIDVEVDDGDTYMLGDAEASLAAAIGLQGADPVAVFAEVRKRKDSF